MSDVEPFSLPSPLPPFVAQWNGPVLFNDSWTANLNMRVPEVGAALDTWGDSLNGDLYILDGIFASGGNGTGVGLNIGTGKVLQVTGTANITATSGWFFETTDGTTANTRRFVLRADKLPLAVDTQVHIPPITDGDDTLVAVDLAQDISNKHLKASTADTPDGTIPGALATVGYVANSALLPGTVIECWRATQPTGFLWLNGRTIGNAASGATARANADTWPLFEQLWAFGALTVSGGRGASASADFAANKTITLPDRRGRVSAGWDPDGTGRLTGINAATPGAAGGGETQTAVTNVSGVASGSLGVNTGTATGGTAVYAEGGGGPATGYDHTHNGATASGSLPVSASGTSGAFSVVQPTIISPFLIKL